ncbi:SDR family oxidoreductase [Enterobacter hormaechei]|nr:SDR family oxidoreductase [Enterobacter hormaechei]QSH00136.1 SDR family oxidoreductase [Enterobacter hormaechei]QSH09244.1 SDR family oxidoreductase [Enterobacter hormaechei]QSH13857.1 SDR family oxidoreductase [Enterobacter hormaechei]QSH18475.1 SDR family oxidoreductase [Enterobacter hormaechei]
MLAAEFTGGYPSFGFAENTDDLFVGKTLLHGDVLMWLMKTLLTSGCTNQRGAGQDIAFNNAGVQNKLVEIADATVEDFDRVNAVNLRGVWGCMKYELQQMRKQESGVIVNCSSIGGIVGGAERANYHAAKHGVLGLTKSAALEYAGRNIRVNAVCPGLIWTPMVDAMVASGQKEALEGMVKAVPLQRHGNPEEIADAVLWLSSDASSYVTGQSISVDGGLTTR